MDSVADLKVEFANLLLLIKAYLLTRYLA
jgi:hypothetical protein